MDKPDALMLTDGSGDPAERPDSIRIVRDLAEVLPVFGFGLGHHLLAQAFGACSVKMPLGHRGSNYPVVVKQPSGGLPGAGEEQMELFSTSMLITRQNHGYAVQTESVEGTDLLITHSQLHDHSVEGLCHRHLPIWSLQCFPDCSDLRLDEVWECSAFWQAVAQRSV